MKPPFFSLITPTYNSSEFIIRCIQSVLGQSFADLEILIIDGLSSDDTINLVRSFNDERIKICSEKDEGIYDAMNKGIRMASGDWLLFLGSDDELYDSNVLLDIADLVKRSTNKMIYGNIELSGDTGWATKGQIYDGEFNIEKMLKHNIAHQSIFYHKDVFKICGNYNKKFTICADYDLNLHVASKFTLQYIDRLIAKFTAGGASTNNIDVEFGHCFIINIARYFKLKIFKNDFRSLEPLIRLQAKKDIKDLKIFRGLFLALASTYFRIITKFHD